MVYLTRRYHFSASHRLHSDALSDSENTQLYGKCNSPHGHGHNYVLHVTVAGPVDPSTGMVMDITLLDRVVEEEVVERLDHTFLNLDVENFRHVVPTTENVCLEIFKLLGDKLGSKVTRGFPRLKKILLEETQSNYFEYEG